MSTFKQHMLPEGVSGLRILNSADVLLLATAIAARTDTADFIGSSVWETGVGRVFFDGVSAFAPLAAGHDAASAAAGSNAALSVNAATQEIDLDLAAATSYPATPTNATVGNIVGALDEIYGLLDSVKGPKVFKGAWDPNSGTAPAGALTGFSYDVSAAGTFDSVDFEVGDTITSKSVDPAAAGTANLTDWTVTKASDNQSAAEVPAATVGHLVALSTNTQGQLDELDEAVSGAYTQAFNNTTDWTLIGTFYEIAVPVATHGRGGNPEVQVFEGDQLVAIETEVSAAQVLVRVPQSPEMRFAGDLQIKW